MEPLNNNSHEQPEEASRVTAPVEKAESVTSEASLKMKIEELTGEEDMEVDSAIIASSNVKSSNSSKIPSNIFVYFTTYLLLYRY